MKHFGLTGINANVQFGKGSGRVKYDTDHFEVRNTADNSLIAVQAASPTNSNDLATKQYVDAIDITEPASITVGSGSAHALIKSSGEYNLVLNKLIIQKARTKKKLLESI